MPMRRNAQAPAGEARPIPLAERTARLETQPQPGDLDDHGSHPSVARLTDSLVALALAAVVRRADQSGEGGELAPVAKGPPAEELHHQEPGARRADRAQAHQANDAMLGLGARSAQALAARGLQVLDMALNERQTLPLAFELGLQLLRQRTTVAKRETVKAQPERALDLELNALGSQQRLHPHPVRKPLALQALELPMQVPRVLYLHAGYPYHTLHSPRSPA